MKIGYSKTFPIFGKDQWEKIWIEDEVTGTDEDAKNRLYSLKKQVENFHYESKAAAEKQMGSEVREVKPKSRIESLIEMVNSASSMKELAIYKNTVDANSAHPELVDAYNQKSFELQNNS